MPQVLGRIGLGTNQFCHWGSFVQGFQTLDDGSPVTRLHSAETGRPKHLGYRLLQGTRVPPAQSGGNPHGTCASGYIPGHTGTRAGPTTKGVWLLPTQVEATLVGGRDHCVLPGSSQQTVSPGQPQAQRCEEQDPGAGPDSLTVAPGNADRTPQFWFPSSTVRNSSLAGR